MAEKTKKTKRRPRGTGSVYYDKAKKLYFRVAELPKDPATGARRRATISSKTKAGLADALAEKIQELERTGAKPSKKSPLLRDWLDRWMNDIKSQQLKPRALETMRSTMNNSAVPCIGAVRIGELEPKHIRHLLEWMTSESKGINPKTGKEKTWKPRSSKTTSNVYMIVRESLDDAIREGLIEKNPCKMVAAPRVSSQEISILEPQQTVRFLKADREKVKFWKDEDMETWFLIWRIAFETGMRQGERFGIVDTEVRKIEGVVFIAIEWQLQWISGEPKWPAGIEHKHVEGTAWLQRPKSKKGFRLAPLSESLGNELLQYMKTHERGPHGLVFTRNGHPLSKHTESFRWKRALDAAGLPYVRIHSARHFFATRLDENGVHGKDAIDLMGHAAERTTMGYQHTNPMQLAAQSAKANKFLEGELADVA